MVDRSPGFFDLDDRLAEVCLAKGDGLERVQALIDFEIARPAPPKPAGPRADRSAAAGRASIMPLMFGLL